MQENITRTYYMRSQPLIIQQAEVTITLQMCVSFELTLNQETTKKKLVSSLFFLHFAFSQHLTRSLSVVYDPSYTGRRSLYAISSNEVSLPVLQELSLAPTGFIFQRLLCEEEVNPFLPAHGLIQSDTVTRKHPARLHSIIRVVC